MCIIAAKPAGTKMPAMTTIENMWYRNHDGAGIMYAHNGIVHIEKGFMKLDDLKAALTRIGTSIDLDATSVVLHFRITTHGGTLPANTHPFPVTTSIGMLQKLKCDVKLGVAHNGIIHSVTPRKGISDTMEYVATQLGPLYKGVPEFYKNPHLMEMVENAVESKLAFLTGSGDLYTVGHFEQDGGIMYSNTSYKPYDKEIFAFHDKWDCMSNNPYYDLDGLDVRWIGKRLVQHLDANADSLQYVVDSRGKMIDTYTFEFAVDTDGKVYEYEYACDLFVLRKGYRAYDGAKGQLFADVNSDFTYMEDLYEELPYTDKPPFTLSKKSKKFKAKK